ncbi:MAG TPA: DUF885 domain-containing protein [Allosphingosinicella sp.]|jgi:uncharacterized protein (DUF885 family)
MIRTLLLASTALLAGCATASADAPATAAAAETAAAAPAAAQESAELADFFEAYDRAQLALSPLGKAYRGIIDSSYGEWGDFSEAAGERSQQLLQSTAQSLRARFDRSTLSPADQLSYDLFLNNARRSAAAYRFRDNGYVFDQMNGSQSQLPAFLINIHRVSDLATAQAYVSRLSKLDSVVDQVLATSRRRASQGVMPPRWVYPYVINDARNVISGAPFDSSGKDSALFEDLKKKVSAAPISDADKARLVEEGRQALLQDVRPAYQRLIAEMERQQKVAPAQEGVWRFANGGDYYAERLGFYTTTDMNPNQIHTLGLQQVARIHDEMREVQKQIGFKGTLQQFFAHMRTRPENYFPNTPDGRQAYLDATQKALDMINARVPQFFSEQATPRAPLVVKAVEPFREKSAGKAFYQRPPPDRSRPGTYYVNLYDMKDMPNTEVEALAFHEGVPGHHLDGAVTSALDKIPPFRRFGGYTAWSEGWGLYAERLAKDMGAYQDPYRDFGRLQLELHRAIRLVVDSGLHHKRWTREQAIKYVEDNSADAPGGIVKAIERYIVYPGQATAYMVGRLKIMELRENARRRLGDRFDIKGFHDAVLLSGAVPLDVMERNVEAWLKRQSG